MLKYKRWIYVLLVILALTVIGCSTSNVNELNTSTSYSTNTPPSFDIVSEVEEHDKEPSQPFSASSTSSGTQIEVCVPEGWKTEQVILNTIANEKKETISVQFSAPKSWMKEDNIVDGVNYYDTSWRVFSSSGGQKIDNKEKPYEKIEFLITSDNKFEYKKIGHNEVLSLCWGLPVGVFGKQHTYYFPHKGYLFEFCFYEPEGSKENMSIIFEQVIGTITFI